jgi:HlyD family secretion protein
MSGDLSRDLASLRIERREPQGASQKSRWFWWIGGLILAAALVSIIAVQVSSKLTRPQVRVGQVLTLSPAQGDVKLMTTGYVVPLRRAVVASKLIGRVEKILVHEGQDVQEGELLAELEAADTRAMAAEARASLQTAQARVLAAKAAVNDAKLQLDRERALFQNAATSQAVLDAAQSRYEVAAANLQAAVADVSMAVARRDNADSALRNTRIMAPFAGRVVRKMAEVGEVPSSTTMGPGGVVELVDFSSLVVEADVSEGRISQVQVGAPAEITLDAHPTRRLRGQVTEIRPTVDRQKATVLTRVKFQDPVEGVLPQMSAKVLLLGQELSEESLREPAKVVVPSNAVTERNGGTFVFVVTEGKARLVPVKLGATLGENREVKQGPSPGTKIIIDPPASLSDGASIKEKV